jgi:hypothetical protein
MERYSLVPALALGVAAFALGCGGSGSNDYPDASGSQPGPGSGSSSGGSSDDATVSSGDPVPGGGFVPQASADASIVVTETVCTAGVYQGQFMTYVGVGGDGGSPGLFSFMWNGSLTIDLESKKVTMTSTGAGEIPTTTSTTSLEIADGGALDGSDQIGGNFFANLSGNLDCSPDAGPPYRMTAQLANGVYRMGTFYQIDMIGNLTADYQEAGAGTPPMLVNGAILVAGLVGDGGAPFASASGSWSAKWVSPP